MLPDLLDLVPLRPCPHGFITMWINMWLPLTALLPTIRSAHRRVCPPPPQGVPDKSASESPPTGTMVGAGRSTSGRRPGVGIPCILPVHIASCSCDNLELAAARTSCCCCCANADLAMCSCCSSTCCRLISISRCCTIRSASICLTRCMASSISCVSAGRCGDAITVAASRGVVRRHCGNIEHPQNKLPSRPFFFSRNGTSHTGQ